MKKFFLLVFALLLTVLLNAQTTYTWNIAGGGAWTTTTNWSPNGTPVAGDNIVFNVAGASTITAVPTIALNNITIGGAGVVTLQGTSANVVTINGTAQINNGGIAAGLNMSFSFAGGSNYNHAINGGTIPTATWAATSNCNITGITTTLPSGTSFGQTFGNILWNCTGQSTLTPISTNIPAQVNGLFEVRSTGGTNILDLSNIGTRTWAGSILVSGGRLSLLRGSTPTTMNLTVNNFTVNDGVAGVGTNSMVFFNNSTAASATSNLTVNGAFTVNPVNNVSQILRFSGVSTNTFNLNVKGNYSHANGTTTSAGGTNNITFNGSSTQTYQSVDNLALTSSVSIAANAIVNFANNYIANTGTFSIAATGTLITANDNGINTSGASGTIQSSGTRTYTAGSSYTFNGGAAQIFGTGLPATVANLTINNTNTSTGMDLAAATTVTGTLTLTSGVVNLNNFDLTLSNTTIATQLSAASPSATVMVRTNGTGRLIRYIPATAGTFLYPIGTGTIYSPVNMVFTANNTIRNLGFRAVDAFAPADLTVTDRLSRYWVSNLSVTTGTYAYTATFGYNVAGDVSGTESNIKVNRYANTGVWYQPGTVGASGGSMAITASVSEAIASGELNNTTFTGRVNPTQYCFRSVVATGNWNSTSTWEQDAGCLGSWVPATVVPDLNNAISVLIRNGHVVTVSADLTMNKITIDNTANSKLTIASGVNFTLTSIPSGGAALTLSGTNSRLQIDGTFINQGLISGSTAATTAVSGTYQHDQDGGTIPTATWNTSSACRVTGVVLTAPTNFAQTFFDVTWNCPNQNTIAALTGTNNPVQVNGTFLIQNCGTIVGGDIIDFSTISRTWAGNLRITGGRLFLLRGALTTSSLQVANFTMDGTAAANYQIVLNNSTATSTATLTATGNVTISPTNNISNILNFGSQIVGQTSNLAVGGNFNHTNGTIQGGALSVATYNLNFISGATSKTLNSVTGIGAAVNLNVNANTVTLNSDLTIGSSGISSNVALQSGATLDLNGKTLAFTGTWSNPAGATVNASATNSTIKLWGTLASQTFATNTGTYTGTLISNFIADNANASGSILGSQSATVNYGNVTINPSRLLTLNTSQTLRLAGTWTNSGTFNANAGGCFINFVGTSPAQTFGIGTYTGSLIGVTGSTGGIIISNPLGVSLTSALNVANLQLGTGVLNTTAGNITVTSTPTGSVSGYSSSSYVNGPLIRTLPASLAAGSTYAFPVGKTAYNLFEITDATTTSAGTILVTAEVFDAAPGGTDGVGFNSSPSPARHWLVSKSGAGVVSSGGTVRMLDAGTTITTNSAIGVASSVGGTYNTLGGTNPNNPAPGNITSNNTAPITFGDFKIGTLGCLGNNITPTTCTIGAGGNFTNLTNAIAVINGAQICGNLFFELRSDYTGSAGEAFPITINPLNYGSGGPFTITFRPQTGVTARVTSGIPTGTTNPLIVFNGADYIVFDGRPGGAGTSEWTLTNTQTASTGPAFAFQNDSKNNALRYLTIQSSPTGTSYGVINILGGTTGNDNLTIENNTITRQGATTNAYQAIFANGTSASITNDNISILNNDFTYFSTYGINTSTFNGTGWNISGNNFYQPVSVGTVTKAIYLNSAQLDGVTINGNKIGGTGRLSGNITGTWALAAAFTAIDITAVTNTNTTTVTNNIIQGFSNSSPFTGISVSAGAVNIGTAGNGNLIGHATTANSISITGTTFTGIITGGSDATNVESNTIANISHGAGATNTLSCINISGSYTGSATVNNNTIYNISSSSTSTGNTLMGILQTVTSPAHSITNNTIYGLSSSGAAATNVYGINVIGSSTARDITGNKIYNFTANGSTASILKGILVNSGNFNINNNFVTLGNGLTLICKIYGIECAGSSVSNTANVYHNSVYIGGTTVAATNNTIACYRSNNTTSATGFSAYNNIFVNNRSGASGQTGKNVALYATTPGGSTVLNSNYNLLYTTGTGGTLATYDNGTNYYTTLVGVQGTGYDVNSITGDPKFIDPTNATTPDLHIQASPTTTPIEAVGTAGNTTTLDIDGQIRASFTPVDLGADAGNFVPVDLTPPSITYTVIPAICNTIGSGTYAFTNVTITDPSGVNTTAGTKPRIYYKKSIDANDLTGWKYVEATGTTSPFTFNIDFSLLNAGSISAGDNIQYFVVAQDQAPSINVGINLGTFAAPPSSVALTSGAFSVSGTNSFTVAPCAGTVTVGTGGNYPSLTNTAGIFEAINGTTLTGNLTVNIVSDLASESGFVLLNQWNESPANSNYTLTIQSNTTVVRTITGSGATSGLIRLNGADRVTFNGGTNPTDRYLVFKNPSTGGGTSTFSFAADATNNTINNCTIEGSSVGTTTGTVVFGTATTTGNDNNTITYCDIKDNVSGLPTMAVYGSGTAGKENNNVTISNCNISNYFNASTTTPYAGIYVSTGNSIWTIQNNRLFQTASRTITGAVQPHSAIYISNTSGVGFNITGNTIGYADAAGTTSGFTTYTSATSNQMAIVYANVGTSAATTISNNTIANLAYQTTSTGTANQGAFSCIYVLAGNTNITGNIIGSPTGTGSLTVTLNGSGNAIMNGIKYDGTSSISISNNNIGAVTLNAFSGTNSGLSFYPINVTLGSVTISNNYIGSASASGATYSIQNNVSSSGNTSNLIGINVSASAAYSPVISNNIINGLGLTVSGTGTGASSTTGGISVSGGAQYTITGNIVRRLTSNAIGGSGGASSALVGINLNTSNTSALVISGNRIYSLVNTNTGNATITGIAFAGGTTSSTSNFVKENSIQSLIPSTGTASVVVGIDIVSTSGVVTISNNTMRLGVNSAGADITQAFFINGIIKQTTSNANIYYNTVYIAGSGVGSTTTSPTCAFRRTATGIDNIKNNIFANSRSNTTTGSKHYAVALNAIATATIDNNIYHAGGTGGVLGLINTTDQANLQTLRFNALGQNLRSGVATLSQINFVNAAQANIDTSAITLRLNNTNCASSAGLAITTINNDAYGNSRSVVANAPTAIGAHELPSFVALNATTDIYTPIVTVTAIPTQTSACVSTLSIPVTATVTDVGTGLATGTLQPQLWWRLSTGTWAPLAPSSSSGSTYNYTLNLTGVTTGQTYQYYVAAQDQATTANIFYSNYNATTPIHSDVLNYSVANANPATFITAVTAPLSGTVTVGSSGATYTTFNGSTSSAFFYDLNQRGISSDLIVEVKTDVSEAANYYPMYAPTEFCGSNYTITIRPDQSSNTLRTVSSGTGLNNSMFELSGVKRLIIDGRINGSGQYLKLRQGSTSASYIAPTIYFGGGCQDITVRYCLIEGNNNKDNTVNNYSGPGIINFAWSGGSAISNITIDNNKISNNTANTTYYPAIAVCLSADNFSSLTLNNISITNNDISNFTESAIYAGQTAFNGRVFTQLNFSGNKIYQPLTQSIYQYPIYLDDQGTGTCLTCGRHTISNNYIGGNAAPTGSPLTLSGTWTTTGNELWPIYLTTAGTTDADSSVVSGNTIGNINMTLTTTSDFIGIGVNGGRVNIRNNKVGNGTTTGNITVAGGATSLYTGHVMGIWNTSYARVDITGNTVGSITSTGAYSFVNGIVHGADHVWNGSVLSSQGGQTVFSNNIVRNIRSGSSFQSYASNEGFIGMFIWSNSNNNIIANNQIRNCGSGSSVYASSVRMHGLMLGSAGSSVAQGGDVKNNIIANLFNENGDLTVTYTPTFTGMSVWNGTWNIYNNMIMLNNATESGTMVTNKNTSIIGINDGMLFNQSNCSANYYNNSILISGTNATSGASGNPSYAFCRFPLDYGTLAVTKGAPIIVKNNLFINNRTGGVGFNRAIGNVANNATDAATNWAAGASNYNLLASSNASAVGRWAATDYTFANWKINSSSDANSQTATITTGSSSLTAVNITELFTAPTTGNLYIITVPPSAPYPTNFVDGMGVATTVTVDIDGDTRLNPPDIGADEFNACSISNNVISTVPFSICSGSTATLNASAATTTPGSPAYQWLTSTTSATTGYAIAGGTSTIQNYNSGALTQSTWFRRLVTTGACSDTSVAVKVTVNPVPDISTSNPAAVCAPGIVDLTAVVVNDANSTSGTLSYFPTLADAIANTNPLATPTAIAASGTYYIKKTTTVGGCYDVVSVVVTINPLPVAAGTITGTATVCQGQTGVTYTVPAITNATGYTWTLPTGATITAGSNTNTITVSYSNLATSGNVTVKGANSCGNGTVSANFAVTVNPLPNQPGAFTTSSSSVCASSTGVTYTVPNDPTVTYSWSYSGLNATINGTGNSVTVDFADNATSGTLSVTATNGCDNSEARTIAITINPIPDLQITDPPAVCAPGTVDITTGVVVDANATTGTLSYYPTLTDATNGTNTLSNPSAISVSGFYYIKKTTTTGGCVDIDAVAVTIDPLPVAAGTITGTATVCQGQTGVTYTVPTITYATGYTWTLPTGATITAGANTNSITVSYSNSATSGNVTVKGTNSCGNGTVSANFAVTVNPLPVAAGTITGTATVCQGQTGITYTVPAITNATGYTWTLPSGATITAGANTNSITVSYSNLATSGNITVYGTNACGNGTVSANFAVSVNACGSGFTWLGGTPGNLNDWNTGTNWSGGVVPSATDDITIPNQINDPVLSTGLNGACKKVDISSGATLTIGAGKTIDVKGNWTGVNNVVSGSGRLIFSGTTAQTISGGATISYLQVNNSNGVTVATGGNIVNISSALELKAGQFNTNGNVKTISNNSNTAYIDDFTSGMAGTMSGNVSVQRYITSGPNGFRYIGAPVNTAPGVMQVSAMTGFVISGVPGQIIPQNGCPANPTNVAPNSPYGTFMYWQENGPYGSPACRLRGWWFQTGGSSTMTLGRGYGAKLSGGNTVTYTGAANTGSITNSTCTHTNVFSTSLNGWNLVANPFPSSIGISSVSGDGSTANDMPAGFDGQIQFYQTSGPYTGTYLTYNVGLTAAPIALGQGFWVRVSNVGDTPGFTLTNGHRTTNNATYYDVNSTIQHHLEVNVSGNSFMDKTDVYFLPDAQNGFDYYDAYKWDSRSEQPTLYTATGGDHISINSLPSLEETMVVPMGVKPGANGNFTFTFDDIATFPQTSMIYLEDLQLGTMTDLRANNSYQFTMNTGDNADRFMLHFQPGLQADVADQGCDTEGAIELTQPAPTVWSTYEVKGTDNNVYATGTNLTGTVTISNLPPQEYVVTVTHASGYTAQEYITVNPSNPINATINASATNVQVDEMVSLTATANNATDYVWNFGDGTTQTGMSTVVHAYDAAGVYNVTLTATNNICNDVAVKTINVTNTATGLNNTTANNLTIYGQGEHVVIEFNQWGGDKADIFMYNALGQRMESLTGVSTIKGRQELNVAGIIPGTYFIQVVSNGKTQGKKVFLGKN